jgi:CheY-like chemotaxis protein
MGEKQTILIAEDIDNNYDLLNIILRKDYNLVRAVNGIEAVRLFSEVNPDIILMDMKMPEMGGLDATRLIRMQSQTVPIIAVTAFAFESDREVAIKAGCDDFLSKPIDIPVLKSLIKKYLNLK